MRAIPVLALLVLMSASCAKSDPPPTAAADPKPAEAAASSTPKVGDVVVAEWTKNSFYEGTIESIEGSRAKVAWADKSNPSNVDLTKIFPIPAPGAKSNVKVGDFVLAKSGGGTGWPGGVVTAVDGGVVTIKPVRGNTTSNASPDRVIVVPPAIAADLKGEQSRNDFLAEARSGRPVVPDGYTPKRSDQVVAEWTSGSWYTGRVKSVDGTKVTVEWLDKSKPSELDLTRVAPYPTSASGATPSAGDFLLVKGASPTAPWVFTQVVAVNAADVRVKTSDGNEKTVKAGDFVVVK